MRETLSPSQKISPIMSVFALRVGGGNGRSFVCYVKSEVGQVMDFGVQTIQLIIQHMR